MALRPVNESCRSRSDSMNSMNAIVVVGAGGPEVLRWDTRPIPKPNASELLIRIRATAVNRADVLQRKGLYPAPPGAPQDILGLEFAGEVVRAGEDAKRFGEGAQVYGLAPGGTYAEYIVLHEQTVAKVPEGLGFAEAAALPEAFLTAYDAVVLQAGLAAGERLLVHAVGSGVGVAAVQIARAIGAEVWGTSRTEAKLQAARGYGLSGGQVFPRSAEGDAACEAVQALQLQLGGASGGADVVLDLVGGAYAAMDCELVRSGGRIMMVGLVGGRQATLDLGLLLRKRIRLQGTVLRSRGLEEKIALARVLERHLTPLFERKALVPVVHARLPLQAAAEAHALLENDENVGKIVLTVG
jgi:NADPH:quinone reductase